MMKPSYFGFYPIRISWILLASQAVAPLQAAPPASDTSLPEGVLVSCRVVDEETDELIRKFRVIPGTQYGRGDRAIASWQSHLLREQKNGHYDWPLKKSYETFQLRFEAKGYRPFLTDWIHREDLPRKLTIRMERHAGYEIQVLDPSGKPAAGAVVAISLPGSGVRLVEGRIHVADRPAFSSLRNQWWNPIVGKTDEQGHFQLPPETGLAIVYVVHPSGIAEIRHEEIENHHEITLQEWGTLELQVVWLDQVASHESIRYYVSHDFEYADFLTMGGTVKTDGEGRLCLDHLPPGHIQLSFSHKNPDGKSYYSFPTIHTQVKPGGVTKAVFGGKGRTVIGKLSGLESWEGISLRMTLQANHRAWKSGTGANLSRALRSLQGKIGPLYRDRSIEVASDGTFRIEKVFPTTYRLRISSKDHRFRGFKRFRVDSVASEEGNTPLDIGEIKVTPREKDTR